MSNIIYLFPYKIHQRVWNKLEQRFTLWDNDVEIRCAIQSAWKSINNEFAIWFHHYILKAKMFIVVALFIKCAE